MFSVRLGWTSCTNGGCYTAFYRRLSFYCLIEDRSGATAIEYGLIAALVSVAGVSAFNFLGDSLSGIFDLVANAVADAADAAGVADNVPRCVEVESNCAAN
jgi:pilus assembly protein Flp/PilA